MRYLEEVVLERDELEALKLHDVDGLEQIEASQEMEVSQPTFARILDSAYKKIADAIASVLAVESEDVKNAKLKVDSLVFLGSGCYGGKPGIKMKKFIEENDFHNRSVALFGTSGAGEGVEVDALEDLLNQKNATIKGKFFCKGKFWFTNKDKPDEIDFKNAKKFAEQLK